MHPNVRADPFVITSERQKPLNDTNATRSDMAEPTPTRMVVICDREVRQTVRTGRLVKMKVTVKVKIS